MANTKFDFENLTKKLNDKFAKAASNSKSAADRAQSVFDATKTATDKYIEASQERFNADKAALNLSGKAALGYFNLEIDTSKSSNLHGDSLGAHNEVSDSLTAHNTNYAGETETLIANLAN